MSKTFILEDYYVIQETDSAYLLSLNPCISNDDKENIWLPKSVVQSAYINEKYVQDLPEKINILPTLVVFEIPKWFAIRKGIVS